MHNTIIVLGKTQYASRPLQKKSVKKHRTIEKKVGHGKKVKSHGKPAQPNFVMFILYINNALLWFIMVGLGPQKQLR